MSQTNSRYDGDTWDLASSVGATATSVAASRALASRGPDALIHDPYAEVLVKAVGVESLIRVANGEANIEDDPMLNRRRMTEQIAVRTRFFDDVFTNAARDGITQAVILASGLDTRAYRMSWPAGSVVFELDQPQVIEFKTRVMADLGVSPTADRRTVAVDLRDDWPTALREHGFDITQPTAWIAEGLLIYLPPEAQDRLLDNVTALSAPGSRFATEFMAAGTTLPDSWRDRFKKYSAQIGSDIDLPALFYDGERNSAGDYLAERGWRISTVSTRESYAANGFDLPDDETLVQFSDSTGYLTATRSQEQ
ncbi:class I SAM-dependent methyltransferase [Mycolicibacterium aichiense]|uniref:S-adenosyl-L-methionine-dependent methyltransferase n=1 Tax=Mycolicibacterium aichiense TaxID=1799 RepID=A0AAD1HQB6_9MYCO|nr:class I SAM-dependent methyltransferase [Mycolicibacterium aichiense]MCV7016483.1 class I SAM-dependent methyltransferase [Mycolicibacterium aichiense]BBX09742.1 putative S-adenosyl-L-methionine-dependent methyltransferase [Mycolicibacterium aichiense]SUA14305.1 O-methyltransferase [Mycolicibacterium aichiense]